MATPDSTSYSIYRIVCFPTGKCYVGQAIKPTRRKNEHFNALRKGEHCNKYLQKAFDKYGEGAFYFELIEVGINRESIDGREIYWIKYFDSYLNGYNLTAGGNLSPRHSKPRFFDGVLYSSIDEIAKSYNVNKTTVFKWIKRGYSPSRNLYIARTKKCEWNGVEFPSVNSAANSIGISGNTMKRYIDSGYACDSDIPKGLTNSKPCIWNGIVYSSITEAAKANGVSHAALTARLQKGHTCDSDVNSKYISCMWNGIEYESTAEAAKANKIPLSSMYGYIRKGIKSDSEIPKVSKKSNQLRLK